MSQAFVYHWTDTKTWKMYIGWHEGHPDDGYICSGVYMKPEYDKRPWDFIRNILFEGTKKECIELERKLLLEVDAASNSYYYNAHNAGYHIDFTPEIRQKMSKSHKGRKLSEEHRINIGKASIGRHKGRKRSPETREKMRLAKLGKKRASHSKKTKQKMSNSQKKYYESLSEEEKKNRTLKARETRKLRKGGENFL